MLEWVSICGATYQGITSHIVWCSGVSSATFVTIREGCDIINCSSPEGSPTPGTIDIAKVTPFPILAADGETVTIEVQITLNEEIAVGALVDLKLVLEGIIPITIPCLEIEGLHIGSW